MAEDKKETATEAGAGAAAGAEGETELVVRTTIEMKNAPTAAIELVGKSGFKVALQNLRAGELLDQSDAMMRPGQGCISNPTGPSC